jgi:hypothetical protein
MEHRRGIRTEAATGRAARPAPDAVRRTVWSRPVALACALLLWALALPASALGASAAVGIDGRLTYTADAGEANTVAVDVSGSDYVVTDTGTGVQVTPGNGCAPGAGPNQVSCPSMGVTAISVDLGDQNDSVTIAPAITTATSLLGGPGNDVLRGGGGSDSFDGGDGDDQISSRDGVSEQIVCGADFDTVEADSNSAVTDTIADDCEQVTPAVRIDAGPEGTIDTTFATFEFSSPEAGATFECSLDEAPFVACSSPATVARLSEGPHIFAVSAVDQLGNRGTQAARSFTVALPGPPPPPGPTIVSSASGTFPVATPARRLVSFVLIAGRTIKVSRKRRAAIRLNCSGTRDCEGVLQLVTARRVRVGKHRRVVTLATARFRIRAPKSGNVKIRLSKRKYRLVRRMRTVKATIRVMDRDSAGRRRTSERDVVLRAR